MATRRKYRIVFTEPVLGTATQNPDLYREFLAKDVPEPNKDKKTEEEVATLPDVDEELEKATTAFHRNDGEPIFFDYVLKGFFKEACGSLQRIAGDTAKLYGSGKLKAYKKQIDGLVFVFPRQIVIHPPEGKNEVEITELTRPLRAQTAKGERIALACSEQIPAGCWVEFEIECLNPTILEPLIEEWLDYGRLRGIGCWRNASYGRFNWKEIK